MFVIESYDAHNTGNWEGMFYNNGSWIIDPLAASQYATEDDAQTIVDSLNQTPTYHIVEL